MNAAETKGLTLLKPVISPANFTVFEFRCKCGCGMYNISPDLVMAIQSFRNYVSFMAGRDVPIVIDSACRCPKYNREVSKSAKETSRHITTNEKPCTALDIKTKEISMKSLKEYAISFVLWKVVIVYWLDKEITHLHVEDVTSRPESMSGLYREVQYV